MHVVFHRFDILDTQNPIAEKNFGRKNTFIKKYVRNKKKKWETCVKCVKSQNRT